MHFHLQIFFQIESDSGCFVFWKQIDDTVYGQRKMVIWLDVEDVSALVAVAIADLQTM